MWYIWCNRFMNGISCGYHQIHSNTWEGQTLQTPGEAKANCWFGTMGQCTLTACDRWNRRVSENSRWPAHVLLVFECVWCFLTVSAYFCLLRRYRNSETPTTHAQWSFCSAWHAARCCGGSHRYVCWCFLWSASSSACDWSIAFEQSNHALFAFDRTTLLHTVQLRDRMQHILLHDAAIIHLLVALCRSREQRRSK